MAKKGEPRSRPRYDDDDDAPRRAGRGRAQEPKKPSAKAWSGFASGSALAKWGMWVEFLGFSFGLGLIGYLILWALDNPGRVGDRIDALGGPLVLSPFFVGTLIGTTLVWLGRARMMGIPSGTGAKKVFLGAFLFTLIKFFSAIGATLLILYAASEWDAKDLVKRENAVGRTALAILVWMIGVPFWFFADLSSIPAMAIVGGALPSLPLRRRAGWVAFVLQILVIGYVLVVVGSLYARDHISASDLRGSGSPGAAPGGRFPGGIPTGSGTTTSSSSASGNVKTVVTGVIGITILLQFAYTALFASLCGAGARAARDAREAEETAEDEDI